ncbi:pentapeptide repeat-containing protein [Actinomadura opuntiae]|uniref:pentapeptide repeat-containing protein n=1 Tax=Actinomadura sp. OS1-43 TaxID=604315 RepID=UPI00255AB57E|nr:pentapeptide repeat-containing protein [Actinomadura sp. OS1-43]MDL4813130.1 pentapeptide repeat-containing protein [Actinomadura sp. OS1-43]
MGRLSGMGEIAPGGVVDPDRPDGDNDPRQEREEAAGLWPIRRALTVASVTAMAGLVVALTAVLAVLGFPHLQQVRALPLAQLLDVLKLVLGTVAGVGALFALVMAYRRQRLAEVADNRDHQRALLDHQHALLEQERALLDRQRTHDDRTRVFNERFSAAAEQLGHLEPAIRLAGVYAMAGLADDWEDARQTCIEVLCAYLRLPHDPDPGDQPAEGQDRVEHARMRKTFQATREVRHTVIRIIGDHLRDGAAISWRGHHLDFTGVCFDGGDFSGATFTGVVSFTGAVFTTACTDFMGARFKSGTADFRNTRFESGTVDFTHAWFEGGVVSFRAACFEGGAVDFRDARLESGRVDFTHARFEAGIVDFAHTEYMGGRIAFEGACFQGGTINFTYAQFMGSNVDFTQARFKGGMVDFNHARFARGDVDFQQARFEGGTLAFDRALGHRPFGLPEDVVAPRLS